MLGVNEVLKSDRVTLLFEAIGDEKVRVICSSFDDPKVILAEKTLQVVAFGKALVVTRTDRPAEYVNIDPSGVAEGGLRTRHSVTAPMSQRDIQRDVVTGAVTCDRYTVTRRHA